MRLTFTRRHVLWSTLATSMVLACGGGGGDLPGGNATPTDGGTSSSSSGGADACVPSQTTTPGTCDGTVRRCNVFLDGASCNAQRGCKWNGAQSDLFCDGSATSCLDIGSEVDCQKQDGCSWSPPKTTTGGCEAPTPNPTACRGTPIDCGKLEPAAGCEDTPMCVVADGTCKKSPIFGRCDQVTSKDACVRSLGCAWTEANGAVSTLEYGTCEGEEADCSTLTTETDCKSQPSITSYVTCSWSPPSTCTQFYPMECSLLSAPPIEQALQANRPLVHPITAKAKCPQLKGCTWKPSR